MHSSLLFLLKLTTYTVHQMHEEIATFTKANSIPQNQITITSRAVVMTLNN